MSYKVNKNKETFLIPDDLSNKSDHFYKKRYKKWEQASFMVYDVFGNKNKTFFDIGGWNGCTAIYASRINKKIISLEPDPVSLTDFYKIINENEITNIKVIESPVYSNRKYVNFAPLQDQWNTSSSQIKDENYKYGKRMTAITLEDVFVKSFKHNMKLINHNEISMIKIDIEGGEQFLFKDISKLFVDIPLYISMHLEWWNDKGTLEKWSSVFKKYKYIYATTSYGFEDGDSAFELIPQEKIVDYIKKNPFTSLVLTQINVEKFPLAKTFKRNFCKKIYNILNLS